jgi:16S rRNA (guanine527-N7)-methyltransferase
MNKMLQQLQLGCEALGVMVSEQQLSLLIKYVELIAKWNKAFNLTSVREPQEMISRHLLDSLAILPYLEGKSLLDVGTGAGLPGIPVAILRPEMAVTLLDSNSKKTRFLQQVKAELNLKNISVIHSRVEQADLPKFDIVTARAFSTIDDIIDLAGRHCDDAGSLVLMKGIYPEEEMQATLGAFSLRDIQSLDVPGCEGQRHLVRLIKH